MTTTTKQNGKKIKAYYHPHDMPIKLNLIGRLKDDPHSWFAADFRFESTDIKTIKFDKFGSRKWMIIDDSPFANLEKK
jgi:hypothetical protein